MSTYTRKVTLRHAYSRLARAHSALRAAAGAIHRCPEIDAAKGTPWAHTMTECDYLAAMVSVRLRELENQGVTK